MKHVGLFNQFLQETVDLNATRIAELEKSIEAIKKAVEESSWEAQIESWMAQGSWAHGTIIKPVRNGAELSSVRGSNSPHIKSTKSENDEKLVRVAGS